MFKNLNIYKFPMFYAKIWLPTHQALKNRYETDIKHPVVVSGACCIFMCGTTSEYTIEYHSI